MALLENKAINTHPLKSEIRNIEIYLVRKKKQICAGPGRNH